MTTPEFTPTSLEEILLALFPKLETSDGHQHISANSLKMAVRCPEQFRRRYVLGQKAAPSGASVWGRADHTAVGMNYEAKLISEKDLPVAEVQERFATEVDEAVGAEEILWDGRDFAGKTEAQSVALVKDRGTRLVGMYQEQVAPSLFPLSVEEEFLLPVNGLPPVKGYLDLVALRRDPVFGLPLADENATSFVVERKTKGANKTPAPDERFQAHLYELATGLPVEFQVSVKTQAPRVVVHEPEPLEPPKRTIEMVKRIVLGIAHNYAVFGEEQPWPDYGRQHVFACSFCSFQSSCPWWHEEYWPK